MPFSSFQLMRFYFIFFLFPQTITTRSFVYFYPFTSQFQKEFIRRNLFSKSK